MDVYRDPLPITLEALGFEVTEEDQCSYRAKTDRSPLAARTVCSQGSAEWSSDLPDLRSPSPSTAGPGCGPWRRPRPAPRPVWSGKAR